MQAICESALEEIRPVEKVSEGPFIISTDSFGDARGRLGVLEGAALPFVIQRVYYLYDVPVGAVRGEHGHKKLEQIFICMNGSCDVTFYDGARKYKFHMKNPADALYVPAGLWRSLKFCEPGTVMCVMASRPYEVSDYIYHFDEYLEWAHKRQTLGEAI